MLKARAAQLAPMAPPGLRTRIIANMPTVQEPASPKHGEGRVLAWTGRLTAFAAAAMVVLTLGAVLLPIATVRSTAVLAAQLALDHLKCFTIDGDADGEPIASGAGGSDAEREFDFSVTVPASLPPKSWS